MALIARSRSVVFMFLSGLLLAACQTTPPPPAAPVGLTALQVDALKTQGFEQTNDGWAFGFADKLLFPTNESRLDEGQKQIIERIARALLAVNITQARVEGHADSSGTAAYNDALSLQRARMVGSAMIGAGMPTENVHIEGLGIQNPIASNASAAGRRENRRVVIIISN